MIVDSAIAHASWRQTISGVRHPSQPRFSNRLVAASLAVGVVAAACAVLAVAAVGTAPTTGVPLGLKGGKQLYRKYCGQCHALSAALAAGFGSDKGLGQDGGPSFNRLRVPFNLSVVAVTTPFAGHERVNSKLTWGEVNQVANYVATVTKTHTALAQPIDD
jgi:mono/diheme cytochrome c family protein